ncbi:MAG: GTPase HflX, partial [Pseudomonadota bacterium]
AGTMLSPKPLEELQRLAESAGARTVGSLVMDCRKVDPAYFITRGKASELKSLVEEKDSNIVICNDELSPAQQRNLEDFLGVKVVDRTGLILDIFAQRARSREGRLQVELAQLDYSMPRLRGKGQEMSRLGGGIGTRGPGETKLEMDRRKIKVKMLHIKKELRKVANTRMIQRCSRSHHLAYGAVLVGYTNAGKSTLLNRLAGANVLTEDRLFSTLDPTTRRVRLSRGNEMLLSDTVGFINRLPHQLIDAFKSTLEEVREAALLLHVIDCTSPCVEEHAASVNTVLAEIGVGEKETLYILNKTDAQEDRSLIAFWSRKFDPVVAVSARTGEGMDLLHTNLDRWMSQRMPNVCLKLPLSEHRAIERIIKTGKIFYKESRGNEVLIEARIDYRLANILKKFKVSGFKNNEVREEKC